MAVIKSTIRVYIKELSCTHELKIAKEKKRTKKTQINKTKKLMDALHKTYAI